jgi:hypothetical protein
MRGIKGKVCTTTGEGLSFFQWPSIMVLNALLTLCHSKYTTVTNRDKVLGDSKRMKLESMDNKVLDTARG